MYLYISFLTIRLAVPISFLVFALLAAGAFPLIPAPVPVLPPVSISLLLTLLVLLFFFLVTVKMTNYHF